MRIFREGLSGDPVPQHAALCQAWTDESLSFFASSHHRAIRVIAASHLVDTVEAAGGNKVAVAVALQHRLLRHFVSSGDRNGSHQMDIWERATDIPQMQPFSLRLLLSHMGPDVYFRPNVRALLPSTEREKAMLLPFYDGIDTFERDLNARLFRMHCPQMYRRMAALELMDWTRPQIRAWANAEHTPMESLDIPGNVLICSL